jgi:hypothetical protein
MFPYDSKMRETFLLLLFFINKESSKKLLNYIISSRLGNDYDAPEFKHIMREVIYFLKFNTNEFNNLTLNEEENAFINKYIKQ